MPVNLSRSVLCLLVLGAAAPATAAAGAANGRAIHTVEDSFSTEHVRRGIRQGAQIRFGSARNEYAVGASDPFFRVAAPAGEIASVAVSLSSDGGDEELVLVESDTRLHGAAAVAEVPSTGASLALTVYDSASAELVSFSGTLAADGTVTLEADAGELVCDKTGCTTVQKWDVELVSAELVPAATGHELALDFGGADAHDVAYAKLYTTPCDLGAEKGICLYDGKKTLTSEVYWNELSSIWEAPLTVDHDGAVDARIRSYDADGHLVEDTRTSVGLPWDDGADGANVLPLEDGDAHTRMGFLYGTEGTRVHGVRSLAIVSDGWSADEALPTHANIELDDGTTISIPANSYQRKKKKEEDRIKSESDREKGVDWDVRIDDRTLTVDGSRFTTAELTSPLCAEGTCVMLVPEGNDEYSLAVTQYRWDTDFPEEPLTVTLTAYGADGVGVARYIFPVDFDEQISVAFETQVSFGGDAVDTAFSGRLELVDESSGGDTLAHGKFYSVLSVDAGGRVGVAGVGVDDVASAETPFAVLLQGERSSCGNDDEGFTDVPPLMATFGNGSGTKAAASQTSTKPQLL